MYKPLAVVLFVFAVSAAVWAQQQPVTAIRVIGNRRIPKETILARLFTHQGDSYDPLTVERDFNSLWNTGYFEDVRIEREDTPKGLVLNIYVRERPTIREINYKGLNSVTQSDVLDRFKKEKVGLTVESQYDPTRIKRAETVLKALLSEHGRQFATVKEDVKVIPPASVALNFIIKEGPKVQVGAIRFDGNHNISGRDLRAAMKNLKPIGIPHSIILENLFAKTYDESKLEEDSERVRVAYQNQGYFKATVGEPKTRIHNAGGFNIFTLHPSKGKVIDIRIPIEEGARYRLGGVTFTGNKAVSNVKALRGLFNVKDGDWFNYTKTTKGLEGLRKAYGELGYINFTAVPSPRFDEAKKLIYLDIDIDEGKAFYVSRIEFTGNTVTRDRVIRRELLLEEGQPYNSRLWELSLLRLNQLNYFNPLKVEQDSTTTQHVDDGTVDLLLKVSEKGKNSIGLNGGISGLSGSFVGLNYQTNNFLGLGETLSVQSSIGNLARNASFGFTEPYFRNKPITLGFNLFTTKNDYNQAKTAALAGAAGSNLSTAQQSLLQNYNQTSTGFTLSVGYPIRRSFNRIGATYSLNRSSVTAFSQASTNLFQNLNFRSGIQGTNALDGIITSSLSLSFSHNTVGPSIYQERTGTSISAALQFAGLGGNVRYYSPVFEFKQFHPIHNFRFARDGRNVFGYRLQAAYVAGFGGDVAPPFNRFYAGGENDIRGFDVRSATPYAFIPTRVNFTLTNPDGNPVPKDPSNPTLGYIQVPLPIYRIASVGGDTQVTTNLEYRIPIAGPVTFAFFDDFNINMALRKEQLKQSVEGLALLNSGLYGCPEFDNGACRGGFTERFPELLDRLKGTNFVPRMSTGAELQVILPIVNAPFRLYYAYNPLRLVQNVPNQSLIDNASFRALFPQSGAGVYSFEQANSLYNSLYQFREPRKTFRLTVSTTF